jgi:hypothetical protein
MKRIFKKLLFITLIFATMVTAVSCGGDMKKYHENGLHFSLPKDMRKLSVSYADLCYGNDDFAQFFVYFYSKDSLLTDLALEKEATVKQYADWFVGMNGYTDVTENYDEENKVIVLKYVYEDEADFYCDYITRNEHALFHVTMCCKEELREKYEPMFDEWMKLISVD